MRAAPSPVAATRHGRVPVRSELNANDAINFVETITRREDDPFGSAMDRIHQESDPPEPDDSRNVT